MLEHYRLINEETNKQLDGCNAANCILYPVNYADKNEFYLRENKA